MTIPKISVILIFYNDAKYLPDSISSILNQSFKDFELVMIDNGSTDNSFEVANSYAKKDKRIKIIRSEKNYFGGAINIKKLLKIAKGEYIKLFCADDVMNENCLEKQISFLEENPKYLACFSHLMTIDEEGRDRKKIQKCTIKKNRFEYLNHIFYNYNAFTFPTALVRKSAITNAIFDYRLIHFFDVKIWLEILKQGEVFVIEENLVKYRVRDNQGNVSNISQDQKKAKAYIFEIHLFYEEFFKITDLAEFGKIFPESKKYLKKLDAKKDKDLLPIIAAILLYNSEKFYPFYFGLRKNIALLKIFSLIENEKMIPRIEEKLGISYHKIRELSDNFFDGIDLSYKGHNQNKIKKFFFGFLEKKKAALLRKKFKKI